VPVDDGALSVAGCNSSGPGAAYDHRDYRVKAEEARQDMAKIPAPSKRAYQNVTDLNAWEKLRYVKH